ncbi:Superoxide dismutase [Mn] 1, mitochondrial [Trichoplax sp. H2]|uniref:Superoxide dismutase n=1 Tax=Trichoplax adhaerens TaxID=10228 RepID=B3RPN1_TRIAD|nr:hypothetical protein TRIADDRAFT_21084 [Trichoplax adhaerens]EDV28219.1 hypothetical protein TRIADDRAFT_21084 [Trichoplax adhaerens]RDD45336.1 Superoxide dismutase [Mn] 1, mitochondrial [Trichoplax sp. H2]|eukprot:XP_002110053.1 hypothetical protein TRIADDRAFT_21084 [Trichoplax adhaerens]
MLANVLRQSLGRNSCHSALLITQARRKHDLPPLPYAYNALEPTISAEIMELHHSKHHQTYVTNLNAAEEKLAEATSKNDISGVITLQGALRFNGGGHINHSIFWKNLSNDGGGLPTGELGDAINACFGSFDNFKSKLSAATIAIQGSGWGWLGYCKESNSLKIATCANQDPLQATTGYVPLLGIDVWEHAYYLQYKNVRPNYVNAIFDVINWNDVANNFRNAKA